MYTCSVSLVGSYSPLNMMVLVAAAGDAFTFDQAEKARSFSPLLAMMYLIRYPSAVNSVVWRSGLGPRSDPICTGKGPSGPTGSSGKGHVTSDKLMQLQLNFMNDIVGAATCPNLLLFREFDQLPLQMNWAELVFRFLSCLTEDTSTFYHRFTIVLLGQRSVRLCAVICRMAVGDLRSYADSRHVWSRSGCWRK